jgi:hypothetical protein
MENTCNICHQTKDSSKFRSKNKCKACRKEYLNKYSKIHYEANLEMYTAKNTAWRKANPDKAKASSQKSYALNKDINKECKAARSRAYHKLNRKELSRKELERTHSDITFKIRKRLRTRLYKSVKSQGTIKHKSTFKLLGCSIVELKQYLESKFLPTMTWENYGQYWHVDHIIPCDSFDLTKEEEQQKCFHYTNLQPLFAFTTIIEGVEYIGNVNKSNKLLT